MGWDECLLQNVCVLVLFPLNSLKLTYIVYDSKTQHRISLKNKVWRRGAVRLWFFVKSHFQNSNSATPAQWWQVHWPDMQVLIGFKMWLWITRSAMYNLGERRAGPTQYFWSRTYKEAVLALFILLIHMLISLCSANWLCLMSRCFESPGPTD